MTSVWHVAQRHELLTMAEDLYVVAHNGRHHTLRKTPSSLWLLSEWGQGARVACRFAFAPGGLGVEAVHPLADGSGFEVVIVVDARRSDRDCDVRR